MYLRAVGGIALATLFVLPPRVQAQALPPESVVRPVLVEAAEEIRTELGLTDAQAREFRILMVERLMRAEAVAASFGDVSLRLGDRPAQPRRATSRRTSSRRSPRS